MDEDAEKECIYHHGLCVGSRVQQDRLFLFAHTCSNFPCFSFCVPVIVFVGAAYFIQRAIPKRLTSFLLV